MKTLNEMTIRSMPSGDEHDAKHLQLGSYVAITEHGLRLHNEHSMWSKVAIGGTIGLVALPFMIGGGIGLAVGGEAVGLGLAELGVIGGSTGGVVGKVLDKPRTGHLVTGKHETLSLVDMVGVVVHRTKRWWDQPGHDIEVEWTGKDEYGTTVKFRSWHNPEHLYGLM